MENLALDLLPPARLAIAYAPRSLRNSFALLLRFDARIALVVGESSEPLIGQMKLAWWREAIAMDPGARPKGEPFLAQLSKQGDFMLDQALQSLLIAWEEILCDETWSTETLESFARERGTAVFSTYAGWVGSQHDIVPLGASWAIGDLQLRTGRLATALPQLAKGTNPADRRLRPLTILALSVRDVSGPRLLWHALTGL